MATPKGVVLFVHGFGSSSKSWQPLLNLFEEDARITSRYDFMTWDYPTTWVNLSVLGRIPRLQELGRGLGDRIALDDIQDRELTLVGHSQGGLVIQSWIAEMLQRGEGSRLKHVRQVVLFATPSHGSTVAMGLRRILSTFFTNPQERTLRVLSPEIADIVDVIRSRVVEATKDGDNSWRIPIHAFCGLEDGIVLEASARGVFDSVFSVRGNHFTILQPVDAQDDRYRGFADLLLDPGGHTQRFEIDEYTTVLRVEPRDNAQIAVKSERNPRTVTYDNYATMNRSVRFARRNRCKNQFMIRYKTQKNGYVIGHP